MDFARILTERYALSDEGTGLLMHSATLTRHARKEVIIEEGQRDADVCFVAEGSVRTYVMREDKCVIFSFSFEGDPATSTLGTQPGGLSRQTIETMEPATLVRIPRARMDELFAGNAELADWGRRMAEEQLRRHEDYFADLSKVSDAGSAAKAGIYQFLEGSRRTAIVVDCENSDPYKLYAMLNNLDQNALLGKIAKIILYDDVHTTTAWQILEKFTQIPVEHVLIERVKENKSLVDIRLTTGTCCEFFQNNIDSFLLASSDSDYWGLIPAMPQARFFVLVEAEKCSGAIRKAMENGGIAYCYLDRFCTGNSNQIKETAMLQAVQRILDEEVQLNLHDVMNEAYLQTRAGMTTAERCQFCERYLQHLRIEIDETGRLRLVAGK